jgi:hypothetical protein
MKAPVLVRKRVFAQTRETIRVICGRRAVHAVATARGWRECRTPYGRARCVCGCYALVWVA